jgi:hypothetical protein
MMMKKKKKEEGEEEKVLDAEDSRGVEKNVYKDGENRSSRGERREQSNTAKTLLHTLISRSTQQRFQEFTMSIKYAKDQPAGFTNRIERVAIVGVSLEASSITITNQLSFLHTYSAECNANVFLIRPEDKWANTLPKSFSRLASTPSLPSPASTAPASFPRESRSLR